MTMMRSQNAAAFTSAPGREILLVSEQAHAHNVRIVPISRADRLLQTQLSKAMKALSSMLSRGGAAGSPSGRVKAP